MADIVGPIIDKYDFDLRWLALQQELDRVVQLPGGFKAVANPAIPGNVVEFRDAKGRVVGSIVNVKL